MIRRLSQVGRDNSSRQEFVERLVVACEWADAEEIWEDTVSKLLDVREIANDLGRAEDAAMAIIAPVLIALGY